MRYCIFGGSFDPPHAGHRYLARSARDRLLLDTILWVPAPDPPHKTRPGTAFRHRLEMVRLAIAGETGQEASDIEATLPSPSYSIQTIEALKAAFGREHAWHFLIGADNWAIIRSWKRWEDVLREVTMVVFPRRGTKVEGLPAGAFQLDLPELDLDSSGIRRALAEGRSPEVACLLPELRDYVAAEGLYRSAGAA